MTKNQKTFTLEEIMSASEDQSGFCLSCGDEAGRPIEPDARNYKCESCGECELFGAEEIALMGLIRNEE